MYDTLFTGIVPAVISWVTSMNLIIVENGQSNRENCIIIQAITFPVPSYVNNVFLYNSGAHYDSIMISFEHNAKSA